MTTTDEPHRPTSKLFKRNAVSITMLITLVLSSWVLLISSQGAEAASHNNKTISIALIGDSYTAGNGAGSYNGPLGSYRSSKNWGNRYSNWLKANGMKATLTNLAWSGKTTDEVIRDQIPEVPHNTDLVMFTAGGNDAEFSEVIKKCFAKGFRSTALCRDKIDNARAEFPNIILGTEKILKELETKLPSTSQVVLVGYPLLSLEGVNYNFKTCELYDHRADYCIRYDEYDAVKAVRDTGKELNKLQADMVREWNRTSSLKVSFVDTQPSFATHEPNPNTDARNPRRWINEFFEQNGYSVEIDGKESITRSIDSYDQNKWYHPNVIGHTKIADQIIAQVGVPSSAKEITPTSSDTDIVFVIDTTGSMGGAIGSVKNDVRNIATQIQNMSRTSRFSLISYQDHPNQLDNPDDYPAKTHLNFTTDVGSFISSVNSLGIGYGGDWEETVYSGAMAGLDQSWRPGVRKIMIIIGDAPAHDPEPITGYTWQQVAQRAYDIDPVEIYAIDVGYGGLSTPEILKMTSQSGGKIIDASWGDIPQAITSSIGESLGKPFGWIQGPYIIKTGESLELDGRGSYAVNGEIAKIEWDLDGDSIFETESPSLLYTHTFVEEFGGTIGIRITDTNGNVGIGSTRLDVSDDGDSVPYGIDNCPLIANQNQADSDNDGIGDDCDDDIGWPTEDLPGTFVTYEDEEDKVEANEPTDKQDVEGGSKTSPASTSKITFPFNNNFQTIFTNSNPIVPSVLSPESKNIQTAPDKKRDEQNKQPPVAAETESQPIMSTVLGGLALLAALVIAGVIYRRSRLK